MVRAAESEGFREARLLLQDWLVELLTRYLVAEGRAGAALVESPGALCAELRAVPRCVAGPKN